MTLIDPRHHALELLDSLYDGVAVPERWSQAIQGLGVALGGVSVSVITHHQPTGQLSIADEGTLPAGIISDFLELNEFDPARVAAPMLAAGQIYIDHEFHGEATLQRMPFYRDFLGRYGIGNYALLPAGGDVASTHVLSVLRESDRRGFGVYEQSLMRVVQPHLRHVLNLRHQLGQEQHRARLFEGVFDALSFPLLACSSQAGLAMVNAAGRQWMAQADCPLGKMGTSLPLRGLLEQACGEGVEKPTAGSLIMPNGDVVVVLPFVSKTDAGSGALALIAVQGAAWRPLASGDMLRTLFALTPAEIRLVHHLVLHDQPLTMVAEQWGLSLNTLRTQLKAIFQKTYTHRQSDLLRLVGQLGLIKPMGIALRS
jgi:DNA-binding CsgD family transcriptional regulator